MTMPLKCTIRRPKLLIKVLGVYVGYASELCEKINFGNTTNIAKQIINTWTQRDMSFPGRLQINKTVITSLFKILQ